MSMEIAMTAIMLSETSYQLLDHGKGSYEVMFLDFRRSTLEAYKMEIEKIYETKVKNAQRIRALYDMRCIEAPTPYSTGLFWYLSKKQVTTEDIKIAFVVKPSPLSSILNLAFSRKTFPETLRVFVDRDAAAEWLKH
jgi:hypothetical protein